MVIDIIIKSYAVIECGNFESFNSTFTVVLAGFTPRTLLNY